MAKKNGWFEKTPEERKMELNTYQLECMFDEFDKLPSVKEIYAKESKKKG